MSTDNYDAFKALVVRYFRTNPELLYALHMALLDGVGHNQPERVKHQRHFRLVESAMEAHEAAPDNPEAHFAPLVQAPDDHKEEDGKESKEEVLDLKGSGLVGHLAGDYLARVKAIERNLPGIIGNPQAVITALYESSQVLLPPLADRGAFPPLVIDDSTDDATFSKSRWVMEIPLPEDLEEGTATNLKQISSTIFHETRHVEQAWLEALSKKPRRGYRAQSLHALSGQIQIPQPIFEKLIAARYPETMDSAFMKPYFAMTNGEKRAHAGNMARMEELRAKSMFSELTLPEEAEMALLFEKYKNHPKEADAYQMEDYYGRLYDA